MLSAELADCRSRPVVLPHALGSLWESHHDVLHVDWGEGHQAAAAAGPESSNWSSPIAVMTT